MGPPLVIVAALLMWLAYALIFLPIIKIFSGKPEEGWKLNKSFKLHSRNIDKQLAIAAFGVAVGNMALN